MTAKEAKILIGIDPGVNTGICIIRRGYGIDIKTVSMLEAMGMLLRLIEANERPDMFLRFEDARKRTWFDKSGPEKWQGAGSIKRDCQLWEEFCKRYGVAFEAVPPKNNATKLKADFFKKLTGHTEKTDEHGRDAAMLIFGL